MGVETERKYLVKNNGYRILSKESHIIKQGYLQREPERTVRIRTKDEHGYITVKGKTTGCSRLEFEYEIPYKDALQMLALCAGRIIEKRRYIVEHAGMLWEIDEFEGDLSPLVVAEIELPTSDHQYTLPDFIGEEVTGDAKYYNSNL
jgi:CYTH domain-containing protein